MFLLWCYRCGQTTNNNKIEIHFQGGRNQRCMAARPVHAHCIHYRKKEAEKNQQIEKWMQFVESQLSIDRFHSTNRTNCVFIHLLNACRISTPISFIFIFNYIFSSIFPIAYCCAIQEHVFSLPFQGLIIQFDPICCCNTQVSHLLMHSWIIFNEALITISMFLLKTKTNSLFCRFSRLNSSVETFSQTQIHSISICKHCCNHFYCIVQRFYNRRSLSSNCLQQLLCLRLLLSSTFFSFSKQLRHFEVALNTQDLSYW